MAVSVIIPAYNEESVIETTLKSIPENVQKIVICNACTDKTAEIAYKKATKINIFFLQSFYLILPEIMRLHQSRPEGVTSSF